MTAGKGNQKRLFQNAILAVRNRDFPGLFGVLKRSQVKQRCPSLGRLCLTWPFLHKEEWTVPWTCVCMCKTRRRKAINTQEHGTCVLPMRCQWNFTRADENSILRPGPANS